MSATAPVATECAIESSATQSTEIATVFTVAVSSGLTGATEARVEFGKTTSYGMIAPIDDMASPEVMLLGMEQSSMYHYRVVAKVNGMDCTGADKTLTTGGLDNQFAQIEVEGTGTKGFIVTSFFGSAGGGAGSAPAFILNEAGKAVWAYSGVSQPTRARMSYDGKYMWMIKANVPNSSAQVKRVKMDGTEEMDFSSKFDKANHDLTVLPDETVAFFAYGSNGCDDIKEMSPDGTVKTIANSGMVTGNNMCHVNAIQYSPEDDTLVFSELNDNSYSKIKRTGEVVWVLGGGNNQFTGDGSMWQRQHNFHLLGLDKLLFFNNGAMGSNSPSLAVELQLDVTAKTATKTWSYQSMPGIDNDVMGDVQRLPNDNTLVTYSTKGAIQEVDMAKTVVMSLTTGAGQTFGYAEWRSSLYGDPPR
jgi:Arylsulfotransferase (ASST)